MRFNAINRGAWRYGTVATSTLRVLGAHHHAVRACPERSLRFGRLEQRRDSIPWGAPATPTPKRKVGTQVTGSSLILSLPSELLRAVRLSLVMARCQLQR